MRNTKHQNNPSPFLRFSYSSFQQCFNRDIQSQRTIITPNHKQKIWSNSTLLHQFTKNIRKDSCFKIKFQTPSKRKQSYKDTKTVKKIQRQINTQRVALISIAPAVIHKPAQKIIKPIFSQRARTQLKEAQTNKTVRCNTETYEWKKQKISAQVSLSQIPQSSIIRPRTAYQPLAGLNKIKVYLSGFTRRKDSEQEINGWEIPFEEREI